MILLATFGLNFLAGSVGLVGGGGFGPGFFPGTGLATDGLPAVDGLVVEESLPCEGLEPFESLPFPSVCLNRACSTWSSSDVILNTNCSVEKI